MLIANDLMKFSKEDLQKIGTALDVSVNASKVELSIDIFKKINKANSLDESIKEIIEGNLLAGKVSVKWYRIIDDWSADQVKEKLQHVKNIFQSINIPDREDLKITPKVFAGYITEDKNEMYVRFVYKASVKHEVYGEEIKAVPNPAYASIFIDFKNKILEYRGDGKKSKDVVLQLLKIINGETENEMLKEIFPESIDEIANKLEGELLDTLASTDQDIDLTDEQLEGISKVLNGLDEFFKNQDYKELETILLETNDLFDNNLSNDLLSFSSTILAGLETVSLGSGTEIRNKPLFRYLKPNLNHNSGYIKIKHIDDGIESSFTLRAGISSKSLYFNSSVNEDILREVRHKICNIK